MSEWAAKRFWKNTEVVEADSGFAIALDGRSVNTPGKSKLIVPTRTMADRIAAEWDAQDEKIDPTTMPWTRSANSAIEKVATQRGDVEDHLIGYADTDLLVYRAESPPELQRRQSDAWDPVLAWIADKYGVGIRTTIGIMPVAQNAEELLVLKREMRDMSDFALTGFHDLVTLTGSYALALSVAHGLNEARAAWALSRVDEDWQIEQWGRDEEADAEAALKCAALLHATEFFQAA